MGGCGLDLFGLGQGKVVDCCEHGNEHYQVKKNLEDNTKMDFEGYMGWGWGLRSSC
jgi:hypothetical protein